MSDFIDLADCPDCKGDVHAIYDDEESYLECQSCGRKFGEGSPRGELRTLCVYWNLLLGDKSA